MKNWKKKRILSWCTKRHIKWLESILARNRISVRLFSRDSHSRRTEWRYLIISRQLHRHILRKRLKRWRKNLWPLVLNSSRLLMQRGLNSQGMWGLDRLRRLKMFMQLNLTTEVLLQQIDKSRRSTKIVTLERLWEENFDRAIRITQLIMNKQYYQIVYPISEEIQKFGPQNLLKIWKHIYLKMSLIQSSQIEWNSKTYFLHLKGNLKHLKSDKILL